MKSVTAAVPHRAVLCGKMFGRKIPEPSASPPPMRSASLLAREMQRRIKGAFHAPP
jgi:hypothetical protein